MGSRVVDAFQDWVESRKALLPPEKRMSKDAVTALFIHFCFQFGASMSGVFLTLYLWRLTEDLIINGIYYAVNYAIAPVAFALGGWLIKRKDRMVTYRIGIGMIAVFYLAVVFAGERLVEYYVLFAVLNGIASSFYWAGYLTLMYDVSTDQNRIRFLAINMSIFMLGGLIGPALAGFIIRQNDGLQGYTIVFGVACFMFLAATLGSLRIKMNKSHHKAYYLKFTGLLMQRHRDWVKALFAFTVLGLLQGMMLFLPNILLFQIVGREDLVGYLGVLYASLSILTGMFISRYGSDEKARRYAVISTIGFIFGTMFILWDMTLVTVIAFMLVYSVCGPLQSNTVTSYYFRLIGNLPLKGELRVESVVLRETFLNGGRVISIVILILMIRYGGNGMLPWVLAGASVIQIVLVWLLESRPKPAADTAQGTGVNASST
ncbi:MULTISPECIES: MFS transporter [unclassified Paenibacillus]|uniref:MFS transporter n=1 Tax=unclassified Paenibacillus TaxID=185978 RepID=UPI001AE46F2B|nr:MULTISPECIES: MFS transporter [unclassified Paenibacillus]MBP1154439.1 YQGE family putative transporter [Paenibacillus sp. PvP091]MBP1170177.1 YQGE family putative transporter [Paenibacillus sp. PvR098]MBP2441205.1 YQGE family putative transporter [Paenibacillus sp. PvP052]